MMPIPPCRAMVMAMRCSVTVSMAAEDMGMFREMLREKMVWRSDSPGRTLL